MHVICMYVCVYVRMHIIWYMYIVYCTCIYVYIACVIYMCVCICMYIYIYCIKNYTTKISIYNSMHECQLKIFFIFRHLIPTFQKMLSGI